MGWVVLFGRYQIGLDACRLGVSAGEDPDIVESGEEESGSFYMV
jgi:hypothetical protein